MGSGNRSVDLNILVFKSFNIQFCLHLLLLFCTITVIAFHFPKIAYKIYNLPKQMMHNTSECSKFNMFLRSMYIHRIRRYKMGHFNNVSHSLFHLSNLEPRINAQCVTRWRIKLQVPLDPGIACCDPINNPRHETSEYQRPLNERQCALHINRDACLLVSLISFALLGYGVKLPCWCSSSRCWIREMLYPPAFRFV